MTSLPSRSLGRRRFGVVAAAGLLAATAAPPARAQGGDPSEFLKNFADQLVAIVNGPGDAAAKRQALQPVIDHDVDVAGIARFCLARLWTTASPAQQQQYVSIFHQVLLNNISGHLGEYKGVSYSMGGSQPQGSSTVVATVINRPNAPPANVSWVISSAGGAQKIVDVIAEGTSLRLQQRDDYTSYLHRHNNVIAALISALQRQVSGG
jgi:phospholipid transport system substrate-binding protein